MKKLLVLAAAVAAIGYYRKRGRRGTAAERAPLPRERAGDAAALATVAAFDRRLIAAADRELERNVDDALRAFAQELRDDHAASLERTLRLADVLGLDLASMADDIAPPRRPRRRDEDDAFVQGIIEQHAHALEWIDTALLPNVGNARVAEHLRLVRARLDAHLAQAETMASGTDGTRASATPSGSARSPTRTPDATRPARAGDTNANLDEALEETFPASDPVSPFVPAVRTGSARGH
ncbi:DUF4142 domain-containing protein [Chiayiivirga flava]|uniref:DUF4142 domain-containing protein n=1 Tax=Chiayiivirga flava TaxID=659595 RepID=A0A7W8FZD0_9GAMM|nr:DUF4142 domain-containing protein [Chiayiivirga flava]MBB5206513.1 hypothetical protein [Chiayiivirga flava]